MYETPASPAKSCLHAPLVVAAFSLLVGLMQMVPASLFGYSFEQGVLAPLKLARRDPMFADDPVFLMFLIIVPIVAFVVWALIMFRLAHISSRPKLTWLMASVTLALPACIFTLIHSETELGA